MKSTIITLLLSLFILANGACQEYFVDAVKGKDENEGSINSPLKSIPKAFELANGLTGTGNITIKIMPGTYVLEDKVVINPVRRFNDTTMFTIEAYVNPDEEAWTPEKMPVILSIAGNNSTTLFDHSVGFLVASENVHVNGLKFLGNSNQAVSYYYPLTKEDSTLAKLKVTQCVFIGDKESSRIQGGIWAHGPMNVIDHCVFYECRNAVLFFDNVEGFEISNTIIARSYESAFWWTPKNVDFCFNNNVIVDNSNVIVSSRESNPKYTSPLRNSIFENNDGLVGFWSRDEGAVVPIESPEIVLENVREESDISIQENYGTKFEKDHLHFHSRKGRSLSAGIFRK